MRRKALKTGQERRRRLSLGEESALWGSSGRAPRRNRLLQPDLIALIEKFWEEHTRASPEFKKVLCKRISKGVYVEHHACFLETTQSELYKEFQIAHSNINISQRSFEACKPWFVRYTQQRDTCCCRYHVSFQILYDTFRLLPEFIQGMVANNARDFIHSLLCPRDEGVNFHKMACVQGTCSTCGSLQLFQMREMDSSAFVKWKQYEYVIQANESKRLTLVEHSSPPIVFMTTFREAIYPYIQHSHGAKWQDRQFRACIASFPVGVIISVVDFSENYTFAPQTEIQSEYYFSEQVCYRA